ncbi:MAG: 2OG-Fe(II) oxygenase [Myxococcales bacterium]|nr:MAG: 2OG-Fe(II) oxygenase [Myxococcales bacterium]
MIDVDAVLAGELEQLDLDSLRRQYLEHDEFLYVENFLPRALLDPALQELEQLVRYSHRNYIPRHKKGGSVDFDTIEGMAPTIRDLYLSPSFLEFVRALVGAPADLCPDSDLHRCALYCYTEAGDHIGYHYDTSYYQGSRYTVLLGLRDRSSARLSCKLRTRDPNRETIGLELATPPGSLVLFNGDKVLHAITPIAEGEERFSLTMQYVTDSTMRPLLRFVSDMKDAIAYFGFRKVFARRPRTP